LNVFSSPDYVRTEIPVRLAHRIKEFQNLPLIVGLNPHIQEVYSLYWNGFNVLKKVAEIKNLKQNKEFCILLESLLKRHQYVIPKLALGMSEVLNKLNNEKAEKFLENTLVSRISRRVLAEQHIYLSKQLESVNIGVSVSMKDTIGILSTKFQTESLNKCIELGKNICRKECNLKSDQVFPEIKIQCSSSSFNFTYIPYQIEFILFQLLKNSIKSAILSDSNELPIIKLTISGDNENSNEITFRISDECGSLSGISHSPESWSFIKMGSKQKKKIENGLQVLGTINEIENNQSNKIDIGLPLTRIYIEYLGGSIKLINLPGFGTDVFLKLPKFGTQLENLT